MFVDGSKLIVVPDPIAPAAGASEWVVCASARPEPIFEDVRWVDVVNRGEIAVSVTSHVHFFEVNKNLEFDRKAAYGRRLAVPVGEVVTLNRAGLRRCNFAP